MATYDIDKITLPSGDVCNLTIPDASVTQSGKINTDTQHFNGVKHFDQGRITISNTESMTESDPTNLPRLQFNGKTSPTNDPQIFGTLGFTFDGTVSTATAVPIRLRYRQYGYDSTTGLMVSNYETYHLPRVDADMTTNPIYEIITTKNPHEIPVETITATAGTNVSIVSQSVKRTGNVVAGYIRFTTSASIAPYAYVINSLPAAAHGAVFTLFDQYNGQINNSNVCLYMDVSNAGLRVSAGNLAAGTYSIYFNYICS